MSTNHIDEKKIKIRDMIENLINDGKLDEAKGSIKEYEKVVSNDIDIISMKAVIEILENRLDDAERVLNAGIEIEPKNFDLLFNLAYVYEQLGYYNESIRYYKKAKVAAKTREMADEIISNILRIKNQHGDLIVENRKKISFFVKEKMDSFLPEIIKGLREEYEIRKIIVKDYNQIDEGMEWADICWFEWCDELIYHGSNLNIAKDKIVICRLHSYEAFTNLPSLVNWQSVDMLICVSEHIRNFVINKFRLPFNKTIVISNGIETDKFTFKKRTDGFKIAYAGYLNYKKGPMLLIHSFKKIYDMDNRFQLYIAGTFQDDRDLLYFNQMIEEWNLADNIHYEGWQNDLNSWLEDKNYIICTSLLESQNISVMQAMSKGIKPLIHNFVGAKSIYPNHLVWNTLDEAVNIINDESYSSEDYRNFVVSNYEMKRQIGKIRDAIETIQLNNYKDAIAKVKSIIKHDHQFDAIEDVTIIIPTYNRAKVLKDDILKGHKLGSQYKLIVDDKSDNQNRKILSEFESNKENFHVSKIIFNKTNCGVGTCRRIGLSGVETKYSLFCDDDDKLIGFNKDELEKSIKSMENKKSIIIPKYIFNLNEDGSIELVHDRQIYDGVPFREILMKMFLSGEMDVFVAGLIAKTNDLVQSAPNPVFRVAEDYVLLARLLSKYPDKTIEVTESFAYVRRIASNTLSKQITKQKIGLHLLSLLVSGYYCMIINKISRDNLFDIIKRRCMILQEYHNIGEEFIPIINDFIYDNRSIESFLNQYNAWLDTKYSSDDLPNEIKLLMDLLNEGK